MTTYLRFALLLAFALGLYALFGTAAPATMKAIRYGSYGPASVLRLVDVPRPEAGPGEVLVRVEAAGVNPIDWKLRRGRGNSAALAQPVTPGFDIAGRVAAPGPGVAGFKPGEAVFALLHRQAGYAEYVTVPTGDLVRTPGNIDAAHAAAIPTAAQTAWESLFDEGGLKSGQTVLIHGAAGGVGHFAVQFAKHAGARVIGTASAANAEFLKSIGVDQVIDYKTQKFEEQAKGVDLVLDTIGGDTLARSYGVVKRGGTIVTIVTRLDAAKMAEFGLRMPAEGGSGSALPKIAELVAQGAVKPEVGATYPLAQAQAAHEQSETGHARGKIVLVVAQPRG
jgi:NADPH:quinone reductase-like Zn-dependent oxidoreductase